ncbi:hypothetical protein ACJMK2_005206 [Sinanodonta woodiana]|uniref:G-protein coupled receptors family 1 profile domain-containing protein n=1 Tax=Sinanodonta woodiana TaxID=1069815 RepID=A0ABD3VSG2_SINWO
MADITTSTYFGNDSVFYGTTTNTNGLKIVDKQTYESLEEFRITYAGIHGYISACVCVLGIMSNIANIVVLTQANMTTSSNVILTWLAVADLFTMIEYFPFSLQFYIFKPRDLTFHETREYGWICYLLFHANFSIAMHSIAIWLTIALAIFRFLYIMFPVRGSAYCSVKNAKIVILIIYVSAVIVCIPNYISYNYQEKIVNRTDVVTNTTYSEIIYDVKHRNEGPYRALFDTNYWLQSMLIKLIPCALLTVLTICLITGMQRAYIKRKALKSAGRKDDADKHHETARTTGMLLAVVILFLITELPQGILTMLMIFLPAIQREVYNPLGDLLDIMALLNNSINFVLYCSMSKQFRDTFVQTFCKCFAKEKFRWMKLNLITMKKNGTSNNDPVSHV